MLARFACWHGLQTSLSARIMGDSEAKKAIIRANCVKNPIYFVYDNVPLLVVMKMVFSPMWLSNCFMAGFCWYLETLNKVLSLD